MIKVTFILTLNIFLLLTIIFLKRKEILSQLFARKILHISSAFGAMFGYTILQQFEYIGICIFFAVFYFTIQKKPLIQTISQTERNSNGTWLYPVGLILMAIFLWNDPLAHFIGILVLGVPDALSAIIEEKIKLKVKVHGHILKSMSYFLLTTTILMISYENIKIFIISPILTIVEHLSPRGYDNFTVPFFYTISIWALFLI